MGTHCTIDILDESKKNIARITGSHDGYPDGMMKDIFKEFKNSKICNGVPIHDDRKIKLINGMGEFAVEMIKFLKNNRNNIYLTDYSEDSSSWHNYRYEFYSGNYTNIDIEKREVRISVINIKFFYMKGLRFDGSFKDFKRIIKQGIENK